MGIEQIASPQYTKIRDERYPFRGFWSDGGICRIRLYEAAGQPPVIVCSEEDDNTNTSITNIVEYLAAEVIARYVPHRFDQSTPVIWVEHYPGHRDPRRGSVGRADLARVTFATWTPRAVWLGGVRRRRLGDPRWHPLPVQKLTTVLGAELFAD